MRTALALITVASLSFAATAHASIINGTFDGVIVSGSDGDNYFGLKSDGSLSGMLFTVNYSVDTAQQLADFKIGNGVTTFTHYSISSGTVSITMGGQTVSVNSTGNGEFDLTGDGSPSDPTTQSGFFVEVLSPTFQNIEFAYSNNVQATGLTSQIVLATPYNESFTIAAAPEPASLAIIGAGIAGIVGVRRRNRAARNPCQ